MKVFKHILVVALLAALLPCGHAAMHHDHQHDGSTGLCEIADEPCHCHSCEDQPCMDKVEIQLNRASDSAGIEYLAIPALLLDLPKTEPVLRQAHPPVPGILAALRTVQLLI